MTLYTWSGVEFSAQVSIQFNGERNSAGTSELLLKWKLNGSED